MSFQVLCSFCDWIIYFSSASPLDPQLEAWEFIPGNTCQQVLACEWFQGKERRLYCFMVSGVHVLTRSALIGCPGSWVLHCVGPMVGLEGAVGKFPAFPCGKQSPFPLALWTQAFGATVLPTQMTRIWGISHCRKREL